MATTTMHYDQVVLSDDQFNKLVELLTPGYEASKLMLAQLQARAPQPVDAPSDPNVPSED